MNLDITITNRALASLPNHQQYGEAQFISYPSLITRLADALSLRANEQVTGIEIAENGLTFYIGPKS